MAEEADEFDEEVTGEEELDDYDVLTLKTDDQIRNFVDDTVTLENFRVHSNPETARTRKQLTKYELTRIIGVRAQQIESGAKPLVDIGDERDPIKIAKMELDAKVIPILIRRYIPGKDPHAPATEIVSPNNLIRR